MAAQRLAARTEGEDKVKKNNSSDSATLRHICLRGLQLRGEVRVCRWRQVASYQVGEGGC